MVTNFQIYFTSLTELKKNGSNPYRVFGFRFSIGKWVVPAVLVDHLFFKKSS